MPRLVRERGQGWADGQRLLTASGGSGGSCRLGKWDEDPHFSVSSWDDTRWALKLKQILQKIALGAAISRGCMKGVPGTSFSLNMDPGCGYETVETEDIGHSESRSLFL